MAAAVAALNPDPARPVQQQDSNLPPSSITEAVNELLDAPTNGVAPEQYSGQGEDDAPRSPVRKPHRKTSSIRINGHRRDREGSGSQLMVEKFQDRDGEHLTTIKRHRSHDRAETHLRRRDELVSGRRVGTKWERSHIHFAPLSVPLQRRLQTLIVLAHTVCIACFLTSFFLLAAVPLTWPLLIPYLLYILFSNAGTSGTLSHRSKLLRSSSVWSLFASYFPARLHRSAVLPPTRKYIFGYHPHGIISHGAFAAFATEALGFSQLFPGITNTLLTLDANFRVPFYRDYALAMGLASVSRESCENILSRGGANGEGMGRAITIVVGGARESLDSKPYSLRLVLKRRKGFIKLAIRTGADLVPVLAFGENDLYDVISSDSHPLVYKGQMLVKKVLGFTVPLFHARGVFNYDVGLMPYRRPLNVVVGRPIKVIQQHEPESSYVDEMHTRYVGELQRIWEEWKDQFARGRNGEMEIVE
ncbi:rRNA-processing protein FCF1 [Physcia stellaris]|nr:rRNA-processing protein FCF1 [Physcia stellaris]